MDVIQPGGVWEREFGGLVGSLHLFYLAVNFFFRFTEGGIRFVMVM